MKYGAMNFPIKPVLEELEKIHTLGFDLFELSLDPPCAHYDQIHDIKPELLASLQTYSMDLVCHLPTFVYTADLAPAIRSASLNEMIQSLFLAEQLKAQTVVLHPSIISGLGPFVMADAKKHAGESLDILVDMADRLGIQICLENMYPHYHHGYDPDEFDHLFRIYPTLKMTLDTGHAAMGDPSGSRLFSFVERFPEKIGHVHVSDNFGHRDDHLMIGQGCIPLERFSKKLKQTGYDGTITFEIFSLNTDDLVKSRDIMAHWLS